jgi:hypothetical protein
MKQIDYMIPASIGIPKEAGIKTDPDTNLPEEYL